MTIPADNPKVIYDGNDITTNFPYDFKIFSNDDMQILLTDADDVETLLVEGVDYNITGAGDPNGGAVTYPVSGSPLATGEKLTLDLEPPFVQPTDLNAQGAASPLSIENSIDYLTQLCQSLDETVGRAIVIPKSYDQAVSLELPVPAASKFLAFNAGGDAIILVDAGSVTLVTPGDDTVSTVKIQDLAVTTAKINNLAVTQAKIANDSINADKIDDTDLVAIRALLDVFNKRQIQDGAFSYGVDTGAVNVLEADLTPAITVPLITGMRVSILVNSTNTTVTPTIELNTSGVPENIKKQGGSSVRAGDLRGGTIALLEYDGTQFILLNPALHTHVDGTEGGVISALFYGDGSDGSYSSGSSGNLDGDVGYYTTYEINSGHVMTVNTGQGIIIIADTSITIAGTLDASDAGGAGAAGVTGGVSGNDAPAITNGGGGTGGGGGAGEVNSGGAGGDSIYLGVTAIGGVGATVVDGDGGVGNTHSLITSQFLEDLRVGSGGGSGGSGSPGVSGYGGDGGRMIILMAPSVTLEATAILNVSGGDGADGVSGEGGGGGGGGAGNITVITHDYTDNGATFNISGGAGGLGLSGSGSGGVGGTGIKRIINL